MKRGALVVCFMVLVLACTFFYNPINKTIAARIVIDNETGSLMTYPLTGDGSTLGATLFGPFQRIFTAMSPESIKIAHGRFQHFNANDDNSNAFFPYTKLKAFEQSEIRAGRPPIFITANNGSPVYYRGSMGLSEASDSFPGTSSEKWFQAVNVDDDRFVKFWINEYARKIMADPEVYPNLKNRWIGIDNCTFNYFNYSYMNGNRAVTPANWDSPFPQNTDQYQSTVTSFFQKVRRYAPDLNLVCNGMGPSDLENNSRGPFVSNAQFNSIYNAPNSSLAGVSEENILANNDLFSTNASNTIQWYKVRFLTSLKRLFLLKNQNKVALLRAIIPSGSGSDYNYSRLQTAYAAYSLVSGDNFFFAPSGNGKTVPEERFSLWKNGLGKPTAEFYSKVATSGSWSVMTNDTALQSDYTFDPNTGQRLYYRDFEGGRVLLNFSNSNQIFPLLASTDYFDSNGNKYNTSVNVYSMSGLILLKSRAAFPGRPTFSPNGGQWSQNINVSLNSPTSGAVIFYTLNGSEPGNSAGGGTLQYTDPIRITSDTIIKAKAVLNNVSSFVSSASFNVESNSPAVEFGSVQDQNISLIDRNYPLVLLSRPTTEAITVNYTVLPDSTAITNQDFRLLGSSVTFQPGEIFKYFPIEIINRGQRENKTIKLSLGIASGTARLGTKSVYTYTIVPNSTLQQNDYFVELTPQQEAMIKSNSPSQNFADPSYLEVGKNSAVEMRSLLKFDLSSIPNNATINSAFLEVYRSGTPRSVNGSNATVVLNRITRDWNAGQVNWENFSNAANYSTTVSARGDVMVLSRFDLKNDVQREIVGTVPNFGWLMKSDDYFKFQGERLAAHQELKPRLLVHYTSALVTPEQPPTPEQINATVTLSANKRFAKANDIVEYTAIITNNSDNNLSGFTLSDPVPLGLSYQSSTNAGSLENNKVIWRGLNIPQHSHQEVKIVYKVNQ